MYVRLLVASAVLLLAACTPAGATSSPTTPSPSGSAAPSIVAGTVSCGFSVVPVAFSFPPGPVSSASAEATALALYRACEDSRKTIDDISASTTVTSGNPMGPNVGQPVFSVHIDATIVEPSGGGFYHSYFLVEINQSTGVPAVIAWG